MGVDCQRRNDVMTPVLPFIMKIYCQNSCIQCSETGFHIVCTENKPSIDISYWRIEKISAFARIYTVKKTPPNSTYDGSFFGRN